MFAVVAPYYIGSRLLNVVVNYRHYSSNPQRILFLKFAGFSAVGGAIFAIITVVIFSKIFKKPLMQTLNALAMPYLVAFAIMKVGCFLNGCCGGCSTNSIFGLTFPRDGNVLTMINGLAKGTFFKPSNKCFPTQLYESGLAILAALALVKLRPNHDFLWAATAFVGLRLLVHPLREFPYPPLVTELYYPLGYLLLLCLGIVALYRVYRQQLNRRHFYLTGHSKERRRQ